LNASTIEGFDFFAVEVEALKIGDSSPAPWFNVVAKPNSWSRDIGRATRSASAAPLNDQQKAYAAYWSRFAAFLADRGGPFKMQDPVPNRSWCSFGRFDRRGYTLYVFAPRFGPKRAVGIWVSAAALAEFDTLAKAKDEIGAEIGTSVEWEKKERTAHIEVNCPELIGKEENEQFTWFLDQMERFARVLRPRMMNLSLDSIDADEPPTTRPSGDG
jgi:Domain of unknown function (DUF4268)